MENCYSVESSAEASKNVAWFLTYDFVCFLEQNFIDNEYQITGLGRFTPQKLEHFMNYP